MRAQSTLPSAARLGTRRRGLSRFAAAFALAVGLVATAAPAHAGEQSWGALNCGVDRWVYSQSFSSGYTIHTHQNGGNTHSYSFTASQYGEWKTYHPGWSSVSSTYIYASVLESASRGCHNFG